MTYMNFSKAVNCVFNPLRTNIINIILYVKIQFATHSEEHVASTKTGHLMMYREVIAGSCMNTSEHLSTPSVKNVGSSVLNRSVETTITRI